MFSDTFNNCYVFILNFAKLVGLLAHDEDYLDIFARIPQLI